MATPSTSHVFISYSKKQRDYAQKYAAYLIENGFDVWIDDRIDYGEDWWKAIVQAVRTCGAITIIMTPDSEQSRWCQREVQIADELRKPSFPLLLGGENWPLFVLTQYKDVRDGGLPDKEFLADLARVVPRSTTPGRLVSGDPSAAATSNVEVAPASSQRIGRTRLMILGVLVVVIVFGALIGWPLFTRQQNPPTPTSVAENATMTPTNHVAVTSTTLPAATSTSSTASNLVVSKAEVISDQLKVHVKPSTASLVVAQIPIGSVVMVAGNPDSWARVYSSSLKVYGYVQSATLNFNTTKPDPDGFFIENAELMNAPIAPKTPLAINDAQTPDQRTQRVLSLYNQYGGLAETMAQSTGIPLDTVIAVWAAENGGVLTGTAIIRFENHIFWQHWGKDHPDVFNQYFQFDTSAATNNYKGHKFRANPTDDWQSFHGKQDAEWMVFNFARKLDDTAAFESISMGSAQIMGFNYMRLGYASPQQMLDFYSTSPAAQLLATFDFARGADGNGAPIRGLITGDIPAFINGYNGPGNAEMYRSIIQNYRDAFNKIEHP